MAHYNKKKKKKHGGSEEMGLNITSMADIFTIILVFLLKSFSSGAVNVSPSGKIALPLGKSEKAAEELVKLEVGPDYVFVEGERVAQLNQFAFAADDLQPNGTSRAVAQAMAALRRKQPPRAPASSDAEAGAVPKAETRVLVLADRKTPYESLKVALSSAAAHGYVDFRLVVAQEK